MHETLEKFLIKWMKTMSTTFKNNKFSEYDMKPARPSNEKDVKPARKSNRKAKKSKKNVILIKILSLILIKILSLIRKSY